jgi:hypothetical protein
MARRPVVNVAASTRDRLNNLAREKGVPFDLLVVRYVHERILYRLSISPYASRFVLKGAMLFAAWTADLVRTTRDVDLLGRGDPDLDAMARTFREILTIETPDDGVVFDLDTLTVSPIRKELDYPGVRVTLFATLARARSKAQIDIGFGDTITPAPVLLDYPSLLDFPAPRLATYPRETAIAEKVEAMVTLGLANTRVKDFYDILVLSRSFGFERATLAAALRATFARRGMELPAGMPDGLTDAFATDAARERQWRAFLDRQPPQPEPGTLLDVVTEIRAFLLPTFEAAKSEDAPAATWAPGGPWSERNSIPPLG